MAQSSICATLLLLVVLPPCVSSQAPDYKVGDQATGDVATPVQLIVIDPERTEVLRQKEAQRTPAIFRLYPNFVEEAEASLRSSFSSTRERFLAAMQGTYQRRRLTAQALTYPRFQRFVSSFQKQQKGFPLTTNLAQLWALGEPDEPLLAELAAKLRDAQSRHIRIEPLPPEARLGPQQIRLVALQPAETALDLPTVEKLSAPFMRSNLVAVWRVRKNMQDSFPAQDQALGKYLSSLVKPNCLFEEELTRQSRLKRTEPIFAADHYEPGQLIVKAGEIVDARRKAALDQMKAKTAVDQLKAEAAQDKLKAQETVAQFKQQAAVAELQVRETSLRNRWLLGALAFFVLACCMIFWRLSGRRKTASLLPVHVGEEPFVVPLEPAETPSIEAEGGPWRRRALQAEQRANRATATVRAGMIPHLARWMMEKVVRKLLWQRDHLLDTQRRAEVEVEELEKRLANVHAPLEDRLRAYEKRIAELERELAVKGAENRELIKARIEVTQKRLALARSKDSVTLN